MAAMFRRPRPVGGRHPPPLAPSVSSFKPRAQWNNSGSSIFLYVNLPGFYMDQIEINKDEKTRTIQIQGQRPLSAQTKARFNESYRVPESCDMTQLNTSFSHGLLTIEFQVVVEGEKEKKEGQDQGKIVQRSNQKESGGPGPSNLGRKKPLDEEKQAGTSQDKAAPMLNEEKPKTYKSVVEGKRAVPTGSREKAEPKVKAGEVIPSVGRKERVKEEKLVERKEATQMGHQKIGQKLKEEEAKSTPTLGGSLKPKEHVKEKKVVERKEAAHLGQRKIGQKLKEEEAISTSTYAGSLKPKVLAKEEKVIEKKKDADISQNKTGQKAKEKETIDASLEPKVHAKVVERKGDVEIGQKLKKNEKLKLEQVEQENYTKPVYGDEGRRTEKKIAPTNQAESELKTKEGDERNELDVDDVLRSKQDQQNEMVGDLVSEGEIQEEVEQKKIEEAGLVNNTGDLEDNAEVVEPETGPLLVEEGEKKTGMDPPPIVGGKGMGEEESRTYDISLVNVGVAALVIMGFGAYVFVPLVNLFS
ncbi:Protein RESTRICTED TEV MOVEMENT 2 [Cardamine amara subsp. amara]|uniref:Protein RESTRICTED TEV MOVEMENT 2 n=1 Tax=Cardamine amara subsp. amara TaxID=228776 RepID=A0ABD0YZG3_CARAN